LQTIGNKSKLPIVSCQGVWGGPACWAW